MKIVIGSRGSRLALWQANWVKDQLAAQGHEAQILVIKTSGDKLQNASLAAPEAKGLFIKEIEEALLANRIDLAVHSMKDLPTQLPEGLTIAAVPEREDPRDVLVSRNGESLQDLPQAARVGTGSLRRQAQLLASRPDLQMIALRGNVDTRLKKLDAGDCDAIVLAGAGLKRLGFSDRITAWFEPSTLCPAIGQGALALEASSKNPDLLAVLQALDHPPTHISVRAERALLRALGGGCQLPIAAFTTHRSGELHLNGLVANPSGTTILTAALGGRAENPESLGARVAHELLNQGAQALLNLPQLEAG